MAFDDIEASELFPVVTFYSSSPGEKVSAHALLSLRLPQLVCVDTTSMVVVQCVFVNQNCSEVPVQTFVVMSPNPPPSFQTFSLV